ncbi:hypothetical protein F53441_134 [Fusarium austroafricanum]|uniref:Uncharacterized protein n=1 Tax=Fusarium austroafricanum TaxID=2364996 RepID=A0A8H4KYN5_9HYPO|nr:hypothetical protein F53441_134 [Fusarium austroafricanum]
MSGTPHQISDPKVIEFLNNDRDFDLRIIMDRSGYPPLGFKSQGWRAQSHLAFPPPAKTDAQGLEMSRSLVRGGKIYVAATGGGHGGSGGNSSR